MDYSQADKVGKLSDNQIDQLKVKDLKTALKAMISDPVEAKFARLLEVMDKDKQERVLLRNDLDCMAQKVNTLTEALMQHQKYLEGIEARQRSECLVMSGVPEQDLVVNDVVASTDNQKCAAILKEIGKQDIPVKSVIRLGKPGNRARLMKVSLVNANQRKDILEAAKSLKNAGDTFKNIYIRKDVHPMVQKEFHRLRQVERAEKEKPENVGRNVRYDPANRSVLVDDKVVDQFKPQFF